MTLLDRIKMLCDSKGESLASLERKLDFGNGTIRRWGETTPSGDKLVKVADYFHVSTDYLLGRESYGTSPVTDDPDENYTILSRNAKKLSPEQRAKLLDMAKIMFQEEFGN